MGFKYRTKVLDALKLTIKAYENLIQAPDNLYFWGDYGSTYGCRLCNAVETSHHKLDCKACPLGPTYVACTRSKTYDDMHHLVHNDNNLDNVKQVASKRLAYIKRTAAMNGVDVSKLMKPKE